MRHAVSAIVLKARAGEPLSRTEVEALCNAFPEPKGQRTRLLREYRRIYHPDLKGRPAGRAVYTDIIRYVATAWQKHQHLLIPPNDTPAQQVALFYLCKAGLPLSYESLRKMF